MGAIGKGTNSKATLLDRVRDTSLVSTREGRREAKKLNKQLATDIIKSLPENKRKVLDKALDRNLALTSTRILEQGEMEVYKEGFYLKLEGTRAAFNVFVTDKDGKLEVIRKPSNLNFLYKSGFNMDIDDYR